ncbi:winged helix-turn-helix transcriptional regulator [Sphingomonas rhizophila]|uniref:winged helix-turn-helix transcriptional regulator n=1 Tax=Sphingomonas rhizophila TaxID=2071607 RepID=UPI0031B63495
MLGPRRFSELRADLPGISANVLTQRLTELEERGLAVRRKLPPRPTSRFMKRRRGDWKRSRSSKCSADGRREVRAMTRPCRSAACRSCFRSARCSTRSGPRASMPGSVSCSAETPMSAGCARGRSGSRKVRSAPAT